MDIDAAYNDELERLGKELCDLRHEKGEKQRTVAIATGVSESEISQIEHGKYEGLGFKALYMLLKHYGKEFNITPKQ